MILCMFVFLIVLVSRCWLCSLIILVVCIIGIGIGGWCMVSMVLCLVGVVSWLCS